MGQSIQIGLFSLFGVFAALAALQQLRGGMLDGKNAREADKNLPKQREDAARKGAGYAIAAAVCLLLCIAVGALRVNHILA